MLVVVAGGANADVATHLMNAMMLLPRSVAGGRTRCQREFGRWVN